MHSFVTGLLGATLLLLLHTGCSPRHHTVILTPDPDGHVGEVEVFTDGGKQILAMTNGMTTVSARSSAPTTVTVAPQEYIDATFAEAIAIQPSPPEKFILYFLTNTTDMVAESRTTFATILDAIKRRGAISIRISGHTDATGPVELNEELAHQRAVAISDLLLKQGVDAGSLSVSSYGKRNLLVPTADGVAELLNRRVEVIVR